MYYRLLCFLFSSLNRFVRRCSLPVGVAYALPVVAALCAVGLSASASEPGGADSRVVLSRPGSAVAADSDAEKLHHGFEQGCLLTEVLAGSAQASVMEGHWCVPLIVGQVMLVVLLIIVTKMMADKRREVRHLRHIESHLARANLAKESCIAEFMNLCSSYIESLEDYNRMSKRKISAGQTEELLAYIKSGKVIEEQRHKFNDVFDDALLKIFPNYVDDVNRLLQPDKQIVLTSPDVLTTELRVLALSRLGIEDASVIARFLGISTNTIYTYRNKLRTRAINRTTFEEDTRKIGTI